MYKEKMIMRKSEDCILAKTTVTFCIATAEGLPDVLLGVPTKHSPYIVCESESIQEW